MTDEIRDKINEYRDKYPKSFKVILDEKDYHLMEATVSKNVNHKFFDNSDTSIIDHISECLAEGKDVVLQGAGKDKMLVHSAKGVLQKKEGGCFIATAVYGSPYVNEVMVLREFRDNWLLKYSLGNAFVKFYYWISPTIANQIARSNYLRIITKVVLILPLLKFANKLKLKE